MSQENRRTVLKRIGATALGITAITGTATADLS